MCVLLACLQYKAKVETFLCIVESTFLVLSADFRKPCIPWPYYNYKLVSCLNYCYFSFRHFCLQIPTTTVRILLNHFKWDKEKLYEKYYTEARPEKIFEEAQLLSPFKVKEISAKVKSSYKASQPAALFDCDICLLSLPKSVRARGAEPVRASSR